MADLQTTDQFAGAEGDVNQNKLDALNTLAQYGRRGLESAISAKQAAQAQDTQAGQQAQGFVPPALSQTPLAGQLQQQAIQALQPYVTADQNTANLVSGQNDKTQQVMGNFYDQASQALPLYRQAAADTTTQYKNAYEERQRQAAQALQLEQLNKQQTAAQLSGYQSPVVSGNPTANQISQVVGKPGYQLYAAAQGNAQYGWDGNEAQALNSLWERESGWNPTAQNPTSTAHGIAQFLDSTWAPYGEKTDDPLKQIDYGMGYIKARYGTPSAALRHENEFGWY